MQFQSTCSFCGSPYSVEWRGSGHKPKYCSNYCRWARVRRDAPSKQRPTRVPSQLICIECGSGFEFLVTTQTPRYCSTQCIVLAKRRRAKPAPEEICCRRCDSVFTWQPKAGMRPAFCSKACRNPARAQGFRTRSEATCWAIAHRRERDPSKIIVQACSHCGQPAGYSTSSYVPNKFCSTQCRQAEGGANARARRRNAFVARVSLAAIIKRDRGLCWLCGLPVDLSLRAPDLMAKSRDHVTPIALGGKHEPSNVRLAHVLCNIKRGTKPVQQLSLI